MSRRPRILHVLAFTSLAALGCATEEATEPPAPIESVYVVPASLSELDGPTFFDHPWPSDIRVEDGSPRMEGYPNPREVPILAAYIKSAAGLVDGFSPAGAGYVRFSGPIETSSLPASPGDGLDPAAAVQLIDIDPASPEHGQRRLVSLHWREEAGVYWPSNTLAFVPTFGFPLRPHTRYAFLVTDALRSRGGGDVSASPGLRQVLGLEAPEGSAATVQASLAPALDELTALGVDKSRLVQLAVFTTNDPTEELYAVRDHLIANVPAPLIRGAVTVKRMKPLYNEYVGKYGPSPNYQSGEIPFANFGDGGDFAFVDGKPEVVDYFYPRFSISVPKIENCPMPEAGYPVVLYAHGTGGDYRSYTRDGTAAWLASRCMASMGVDQIFHGLRPGAPKSLSGPSPSLLFFNAQNLIAARTNARQSAIDEVQRVRLFTESQAYLDQVTTVTSTKVRFDPSKVMFFGHSQGGLNGPLFLAADDSIKGAVLSGSSAVMSITLTEKTKPEPSIVELVRLIFLALNEEEAAELSPFHPAISLAQMLVDVADPIHYARNIILEPRPGASPKSIYMTEGIDPNGVGDSYAPPHGIEAHAIAMGLPLQLPWQRSIEELAWGGPGTIDVPEGGITRNLADGASTGVLAQWPVREGSDGHFVIFTSEGARNQSTDFLRSFADAPPGTIPAVVEPSDD
jgi:predicted esterase